MFAFLQTSPQIIVVLALGFIISFILSMGVGGNDVANFFGTSVGTKTLTLVQVIIIASIFELGGVMLLGMRVSDTIRKGIIKLDDVVDAYQNSTTCLKPFVQDINNTLVVPDNYRGCPEMITLLSSFSALVGSATWLTVANILKMPVSTTHSIVGATVGAGLVALEGKSISWSKVTEIVLSWIISPVFSGLVSFLLYIMIYKLFFKKQNSFNLVLRFLPFFYFITIFINLFSIIYEGTPMLGFDKVPSWGVVILSVGVGLIVVVLTIFVFNPMMARRIEKKIAKLNFAKQHTPDTAMKLDTTSDKVSHTDVSRDSNHPNGTVMLNNSTSNLENQTAINNTNMETANANDRENIDSRWAAEINNNNINSITKTDDNHNNNSNELHKHESQGDIIDSYDKSFELIDYENSGENNGVVEREASDIRTNYLFHVLQIMMACFGSFVHGGNDISNSISPLMSIWLVYSVGSLQSKSTPPPWLLFFGAVGIVIGLSTIGYRVIGTIGKRITKIAPSSAFCIEFGSAFTVLIATRIGLPVSTTHCQIGSVVAVGLYRNGRKSLNKNLLISIAFSWIITLPFAGLVSAAVFAGLRYAIMTVNVPPFPVPPAF